MSINFISNCEVLSWSAGNERGVGCEVGRVEHTQRGRLEVCDKWKECVGGRRRTTYSDCQR